MARLELQLFGYPSARLAGRSVDLNLRKGLALLAYLADAVGPVGRDHVAGLLWPEADEDAARGTTRPSGAATRQIAVSFSATSSPA